MKRKLWINAALLAAVVALALLAWLRPQKDEAELKLTALKASEVTRIGVEIAGSPPIALERTQSGWRIASPLSMRADEFQVQRLLGLLDATARERFPATGLARFDLNEPYARVTLNQQSFSFGAVNELSREQYLLTQDGVYLVNLRYGAALPKNALQLASKQLFDADEVPVGFELQAFTLAQHDGKWSLTPPQPDASADDVNRWVDDWKLATAAAVQPASGRKPLETIKVRFKSGGETALTVFEKAPELVLGRGERNLEYRFSGSLAKRLLAPPGAAEKAAN